MVSSLSRFKLIFGLGAVFVIALALACTTEKIVEVPGETVVVEKVVVETIEVPGETVIKEVVKTIEVPGQTVIKEVVKTVEVPGQTVIKEVVKTVEVIKEVAVPIEVVKEVIKEVFVGGPEGEVIILQGSMPSVSGWTSNCGGSCYWSTLMNVTETLLHGGKDANGHSAYRGKVVSGWEFAPDFSYLDWEVKQGNYFHQGFGEVTAEDIAWTYNEGDPRFASDEAKELTGGTILHKGLPEPWIGKMEVLDKYHVRMPLILGRPPATGLFEFTDDSYPVGVYSKRAFDEMGHEWVTDNVIGSGPYEYEIQDSDVKWVMIARTDFENEDEHLPFIYKWSMIKIPDANVQLAMYKAGQGHIAWFETTATVIELLDEGHSKVRPNGGKGAAILSWMGNYWETKDGITGEALERVAHGAIGNGGDEYPWVCGPGSNPLKPEVSPCNSAAKKFRQALFMGIDRRALLDGLSEGRGQLILSPNANLDDPFLQKHGDRWGDPYDPAKAKAIYDEWKTEYTALGGNLDKVMVSAWIGTGGRAEFTEALLSGWEELFGINWEMDNTPQSAWSPGAWRGREGYHLVKDISLTYRGNSMTWDIERWYSSIGQAGLGQPGTRNEGMELLAATEAVLGKSLAWNDPKKREELTLVFLDWLYDQHIMTGVYEGISGALYRSDYIEKWTDRVPGVPWILWDPESVTLVR